MTGDVVAVSTGHSDVQEGDVRYSLYRCLQSCFTVQCNLHVMTLRLQERRETLCQVDVVVGHKDVQFRLIVPTHLRRARSVDSSSGRRTVKQEPIFNPALITETVPP